MIPPRIITLMPSLGRTNEYEVVATARAISAILQVAGLDWHDVAQACQSATASTKTSRGTPLAYPPSFGDLARATRDLDRGRLTPRERVFVGQMCAQGFTFRPTSAQAAWLASIFDRLQEGRAAA